MRAMIEFTLPEEDEEYKNAMSGTKYKWFIDEMFSKLRSMDKHSEKREYDITEIREMILTLYSEMME